MKRKNELTVRIKKSGCVGRPAELKATGIRAFFVEKAIKALCA